MGSRDLLRLPGRHRVHALPPADPPLQPADLDAADEAAAGPDDDDDDDAAAAGLDRETWSGVRPIRLRGLESTVVISE